MLAYDTRKSILSGESVALPNLNPTTLDRPAYLLNVPFSLQAQTPNNIWMQELKPDERNVDISKALKQFLQLYNFMAAESVVYLLPTPRLQGLQDLVYTANLGIVIDHIPDHNSVILSNFSSKVRIPESNVGERFFQDMGYNVVTSPFHFEGEAELKHLFDNVYVGGYGIRSDERAYRWMEEQFDMKIVTLKESDPYLYHLDCTLFPLTKENTFMCTSMYSKEEIKQIESVTNIIDISQDDAFSGICNSVRMGNIIMNASNIHEMKRSDEYYNSELQKNRTLEDIAVRFGFEVAFFNMSEFLKSGALLSCMVMHLNRKSYDIKLT
ncbi:amidinotransferase [Candidatus Sulfurimonas marisnigri]|uniref:Amidinotransferase n=1 Tax=Candidatus Sulfurimonas marisnigri TaxID=2740405 RepID=A0A7S7M1V2_9BACT|nr:amidinotransferase [Candidatus Sulfurimonas marisnigri]QOY54694.1 amidinotransferase [Candidatus Sulfurimonas marisnigri]